MTVRESLSGLTPEPLWRYFDLISQIPRCSGHEDQIQSTVKKLGQERGLEVREDGVGNVVLVIPAAAGCEAWPTVVLQGHTDMVCEKNSDVDHDFFSQGIDVIRDGEWLTANGTTLGADNGVAVASALALLDDAPEKHGALELCFTIDEERGLTGAGGIEPHMLTGRMLLNLDSEEEGFVTVGCAGGGDTKVRLACTREQVPGDWERISFGIKGLTGGHSGMDIIHNRANSIRCLGRGLDAVAREAGGLRIFTIEGGSMRNAIPREASAVVAVPAGGRAKAEALITRLQAELAAEFAKTDPNLRLSVAESKLVPPGAFTAGDSQKVVALLLAIPSGVIAMSRDIEMLPETSNNLGVVRMDGDTVELVNCGRSSVGSALEAVRAGIRAPAEALGAEVNMEAGYPGWQPDLDSELLAVFKAVHQDVTGKPPEVLAIHAGLECGLLGEKFPGMDMISFGPEMHGVHSPEERLNIASTQRFYALLKTLLSRLRG